MTTELAERLRELRAVCNKHIQRINRGAGVNTPGFVAINELLKACDKVFAALSPSSAPELVNDGLGASMIWANLPTGRPWTSLTEAEKALVVRTFARAPSRAPGAEAPKT